MTLTIAPETEKKLQEKAAREGRDINALADALLADILASEEQSPPGPRPYGLCAGQFTVPHDFDAPLPEDVLRDFEGSS